MKEKDDKLSEKVKSSFDQRSRKAPALAWEGLSASLDGGAPSQAAPEQAELGLYRKIRESYSARHRIAPSRAWKSINKQLNIDLVWTRISKELDREGGRERHWRQWAAVATMLLLMSGFAGAYYLKKEGNIPLSGGKAEAGIASPKAREAAHPAAGFYKGNDNANAFGSDGKRLLSRLGRSGESLPGHRAGQPEKGTIFEGGAERASRPIVKSVPGLPDNIVALDRASAPPTANSSAPVPDSLPDGVLVGLLKVRQTSLAPAGMQAPAVPDLLPSKRVTAAESDAAGEKEPVEGRLSLGLAFSYHNSWLLNNETQRSFEKGSLISASPTFKESVGLTVGYHMGNKSLVTLGVNIAKAGQDYKTFGGGSYSEKGLELIYYKGYLQYQHSLLQNSKSPLSGITIQAGLFAGLLHERQGELRDTESRYSRHDYGVRGALGQEKRVAGLTIGYGVSVERGLKNIFLGSGNMPGRFNKTYTLNIGPYLNFRLNP
ncbi:hypothetical protein [Pontibacter pamirensis]|uniref:hypothetical protein n=1 Tax=Pontibacter pamirensis TaxID=2562824 RepID=UPI00138A3741|nr:hypothetical protein [Pontibacter pamirensis]